MGVFDNFTEIDGIIFDNSWIEWQHILIPNKENWFRTLMRSIMAAFGHCLTCTALDGCYFLNSKSPRKEASDSDGLLHPRCHCTTKSISYEKVKQYSFAELNLDKITKYIFGDNSKGKRELFESWGFTIKDSDLIKDKICLGAKENYLKGNYVLKKLDKFGQRLAIPVTLSSYTFYSGWMLHPEGRLVNTTPFGGRL